jgi:uncharacterized membrane protein
MSPLTLSRGPMLAKIFRSVVLSGAVAICTIVAAGSQASASQQRFTYRVHDSVYGEIGTYIDAVEKSGDATTIATEAHMSVSILGIVLYRQDISRIERWVANRLVYFHGVTTENGTPVEVDGRAEADNFIVSSPGGQVTAPGTIRSASPWAAGAPGGDTIFLPDTGVVTKVHTSGGEETSVTIDGASSRARQYHIETADGQERYEVWMDDDGTPVMFNMQDKDSNVTFTLAK